MPKHCCYGTCNSDSRYKHREDMEGVFFMPFPKPKSQPEKCRAWIRLCGRPYETFNEKMITKDTYICSKVNIAYILYYFLLFCRLNQ